MFVIFRLACKCGCSVRNIIISFFEKLCFFVVFVEPQSRALPDPFFGGKVIHQPGRADRIVLDIKTKVCTYIQSILHG